MHLKIERKWWVLIAADTGSFMAALDGSVVNTTLPVMRDAFQSQIAAIEWVVTVYLTAAIIALLGVLSTAAKEKGSWFIIKVRS